MCGNTPTVFHGDVGAPFRVIKMRSSFSPDNWNRNTNREGPSPYGKGVCLLLELCFIPCQEPFPFQSFHFKKLNDLYSLVSYQEIQISMATKPRIFIPVFQNVRSYFIFIY